MAELVCPCGSKRVDVLEHKWIHPKTKGITRTYQAECRECHYKGYQGQSMVEAIDGWKQAIGDDLENGRHPTRR